VAKRKTRRQAKRLSILDGVIARAMELNRQGPPPQTVRVVMPRIDAEGGTLVTAVRGLIDRIAAIEADVQALAPSGRVAKNAAIAARFYDGD